MKWLCSYHIGHDVVKETFIYLSHIQLQMCDERMHISIIEFRVKEEQGTGNIVVYVLVCKQICYGYKNLTYSPTYKNTHNLSLNL